MADQGSSGLTKSHTRTHQDFTIHMTLQDLPKMLRGCPSQDSRKINSDLGLLRLTRTYQSSLGLPGTQQHSSRLNAANRVSPRLTKIYEASITKTKTQHDSPGSTRASQDSPRLPRDLLGSPRYTAIHRLRA